MSFRARVRRTFEQLAQARQNADDVMGINRRNLDYIMRRNRRADYPIADDKLLAKEMLAAEGIAVSPTLTTFSSFSELSVLPERLADYDSFVVKPCHGRAGRGILVVASRSEDGFHTPGGRVVSLEKLERWIADIVFGVYSYDRPDVAIIEPRLVPAPFFADLYPNGLSDVRVICVDEEPEISMIRVPTVSSDGRANLHQGALGLGLNLETGVVERAWHKKRPVLHHPDAGEPLLGRQVPHWREIVELARGVARAVPLKYIGVDIVVDVERGPLVMEFNVRPGLEIQNVTATRLRAHLERRAPQGAA